MELIRWAPFGELDSFERRVRRFLGDAGLTIVPLPAADVYETEDEFVVEVEAPGFSEQELVVETTDHTLRVAGAHGETTERAEKAFRQRERLSTGFERRFVLPPDVDPTKLEASFERGVLRVRAPIDDATTPHKVPIAPAV